MSPSNVPYRGATSVDPADKVCASQRYVRGSDVTTNKSTTVVGAPGTYTPPGAKASDYISDPCMTLGCTKAVNRGNIISVTE